MTFDPAGPVRQSGALLFPSPRPKAFSQSRTEKPFIDDAKTAKGTLVLLAAHDETDETSPGSECVETPAKVGV